MMRQVLIAGLQRSVIVLEEVRGAVANGGARGAVCSPFPKVSALELGADSSAKGAAS